MLNRPWRELRSTRSASILETIAVDDMVNADPITNAAGQSKPASLAKAIDTAIETTTCAPPKPNTFLRMAYSCGKLNSKPILNIKNTMPNSANSRLASVSGNRPKV